MPCMWLQRTITIVPKPRGFHLITDEVVNALPELRQVQHGMLNVFVQHTSASLTINENADASVRRDMEAWFRRTVPDESNYFEHTYEGEDVRVI